MQKSLSVLACISIAELYTTSSSMLTQAMGTQLDSHKLSQIQQDPQTETPDVVITEDDINYDVMEIEEELENQDKAGGGPGNSSNNSNNNAASNNAASNNAASNNAASNSVTVTTNSDPQACDVNQPFVDSGSHTCTTALERLQAGAISTQEVDTAVAQNCIFTDEGFPTDYAIQWADYKSGVFNAWISYLDQDVIEWGRLYDLSDDLVLYGQSGPQLEDIASENYAGTSYILSTAASLLIQDQDYITDLIAQEEINSSGIYNVNVFQKGEAHQVTVDDYDWLLYGDDPVAAKYPNDAIWMPLIEKAIAKAFGNYEKLTSFYLEEPMVWMTGRPAFSDTNDDDASIIWDRVKNNLLDGNIVTAMAGTGGSSLGLESSTVYSVLNTYSFFAYGQQTMLYLVRQNIGDLNFVGQYASQSSFNNYQQNLVGWNSKDDQSFYMTDAEYKQAFSQTAYGIINPDLTTSSVSDLTADSESHSYTFTLSSSVSDLVLDVNTYSPKLYSYGCSEADPLVVQLSLSDSQQTLDSIYTYAYSGSVNIQLENLPAGTYTIDVTVDPTEGADNSYELRVLTEQAVSIQEVNSVALEVVESDFEPTCLSAYDRLLAGPDDYKNIIGSGSEYTDTSFYGSDIIYWPGYTDYSQYSTNINFQQENYNLQRMSDNPQVLSLAGTDSYGYHDVAQGILGDCYLIASMSSVQEANSWFSDNMIITESMNEEGIYAVQFFVSGFRTIVTVDDYFLTKSNNDMVYAQISEDGGMWAALVEKAAAKLFGNYENLASGNIAEGLFYLTGFPGENFSADETLIDDVLDDLYWALQEHAFITLAGSSGSSDTMTSANGIVMAHAYSILDIQEIYDDNGDKITDLLTLRNPWGSEEYVGPWSDNSDLWTDNIKAQVDYVNADDGYFHIDIDTFLGEFETYSIQYYEEGMSQSVFYVDELEYEFAYGFEFTLNEDADMMAVGAMTISPRMYAHGCNAQDSSIQVQVYKVTPFSQTYMGYSWVMNQFGFGAAEFYDLDAGTYYAQVKIYEGSDELIENFTFGVWTYETVDITSSQGFEQMDAPWHFVDEDYNESNITWM